MREKLNINFEISEKDKKLLIVLLAVAILAAAWFLGYNNFMELKEGYKTETQQLKVKKKDLVEKNNNKEKYISDTQNYKNVYGKVLSGYANGSSQETLLLFLQKAEGITGSWIKSVTFTDSSDIYTFGAISSTNPSHRGQKVYSTDMKGNQSTITLSYEASYDAWKNLISFINGYYSKNRIDTISMSYNSTTGMVIGNITLSTYCITGSQRAFTTSPIQLPTGTENIFASESFVSSQSLRAEDEGAYIYSDYDCYILLNSSTSDIDACVIGKRNDAANKSVITSNNNSVENVTMKFAGSDGKYAVSYTIGDKIYPAQNYESGDELNPQDTLDLLIMSSSRVSDSDKSGINLTLENESDMTLNVKVTNDDITSPRVNIGNKTGKILLY